MKKLLFLAVASVFAVASCNNPDSTNSVDDSDTSMVDPMGTDTAPPPPPVDTTRVP